MLYACHAIALRDTLGVFVTAISYSASSGYARHVLDSLGCERDAAEIGRERELCGPREARSFLAFFLSTPDRLPQRAAACVRIGRPASHRSPSHHPLTCIDVGSFTSPARAPARMSSSPTSTSTTTAATVVALFVADDDDALQCIAPTTRASGAASMTSAQRSNPPTNPRSRQSISSPSTTSARALDPLGTA